MAAVNFKKVIQELVVPELQAIKTDVATIKVEIKRLDEKIDNGLQRLDEKIDSMRNEFSVRFASLEREVSQAIDIHERLATLEAKFALH